MERLLQYLDDLDDLVYAIALAWERIRTLFNVAFLIVLTVVAQAIGIYLAVEYPPMAVAAGSLLTVMLLYRGTVRRLTRATA